MAQTGKNKLRRWEHPAGSGIRVREIINRYAGTDGGLYESFDLARTWRFVANLPVTQFYKVAVDDAAPFPNVYGGTQDNNTLGGPSRTVSQHGIVNGDWFVTVGGDGFQSQVDPVDPNLVYSQLQYGVLRRFDRRLATPLLLLDSADAGCFRPEQVVHRRYGREL